MSLVLLTMLSTSAAHAAPASDRSGIRTRIDHVVALLQAHDLARAERRKAILREVEPVFDWHRMARAALGPIWRDRTPAEREQSTQLLAKTGIRQNWSGIR